VGIAVFAFRDNLRAALGRVRSIRGAGLEAELLTESQQGSALQVSQAAGQEMAAIGTEFPPAHPVYTAMDAAANAILDEHIGVNPDKRFAWAVRMRSISETNRLHEVAYRYIFGSQLRALERLNGPD